MLELEQTSSLKTDFDAYICEKRVIASILNHALSQSNSVKSLVIQCLCFPENGKEPTAKYVYFCNANLVCIF